MRRRHERGIALLVATVAAIALAFSGMALVRAVSTNAAINGNLDARQHATLAASVAVERAVAALFEAGGIADTTADDPSHNYVAARQPGEDRRGVPVALQALASYPAAFTALDAGESYTARHVVERLCLAPGAATVANCTLSPPSVAAASGAPAPGEPPRTPYYRVTVRVDGPAAAATFVQAMLSPAHPTRPLSWRTLDE